MASDSNSWEQTLASGATKLSTPFTLSPSEERVNALTHGIGCILSVIGAGLLLMAVWPSGDIWRLIGCGLYGGSLISVYLCSTLSHCFSDPHLRHRFRKWDQACIYLLIVGTYTPFGLAYLRTDGWWLLLVAMWAVAIGGFVSKLLYSHRIEGVSIVIYIVLGWMPIITVSSLVHILPGAALWSMLAGGLSYTLGTVFLMNDHRMLHFHGVWHLFVMTGSALHFFAILFFVAQAA